MASNFQNITVHGLKELSDAMQKLPEAIAKNVLRGSVNAAAAVIRDEAKRLAPVMAEAMPSHQPPGTLKRSLIVKQIPEKSSITQQTFYVTVRQGKKYQGQGKKGNKSQDAYYAKWVEFGHFYVPPKAAGTSWKKHRAQHQTKFVPAKPFLRPAFESKKEEALQALKDYLEKRLPEEAAKLNKGPIK